jgi:hypothetical protein
LLFEARFAHELYRCGITPKYKYRAGVGDSTIDFAIMSERDLWLIEMVIAEETKAVARATYEWELMDQSGDALGVKGKFLELRSDATDQRNEFLSKVGAGKF